MVLNLRIHDMGIGLAAELGVDGVVVSLEPSTLDAQGLAVVLVFVHFGSSFLFHV